MSCSITWAAMIINMLGKTTNRRIYRELKTIWRESFNDSEDYIDFFFDKRFEPENTIIAICNDHVVGALYLFPSFVISSNKEIPILFGYALGVLKAYRGQGISKEIHDFLYHHCDVNNCAYIFHAANKKLENYYESIGIKKASIIKKAIFSYSRRNKTNSIMLSTIRPEEYEKLRNDCFMRDGFLIWDEAAIQYAILENEFCGGFCKKIIHQTKEYIVLGKVEDDMLTILETTIPDSLLPDMLRNLAAYFKVRNVTVYLPSISEIEGTVIGSTMGYNTQILSHGYWNLLLS